ncbi:MAG: RDD family protein [Acidimicrobiia bacterium]|nr:RDD family protein [Acidimicrobiia bacterium]
MDDYYRILDVAPDAPREEIRESYKARRADLEARGTDESRPEVARLNRAWNVLSDPTQRERYDSRLAGARAEDEAGTEADAGRSSGDAPAEVATERPRRRRFLEPRDRSAAPAGPTIEIPAGTSLSDSRSRLSAMGIDFAILLAIFVVVLFYAAPALQEQRYPDQFDRLDVLDGELDAANEVADAAGEAADAAEESADAAETAGADDAAAKAEAAKAARAEADAADTDVERVEDQIFDVQEELRGYAFLLQEAAFLLALAYLVVPSARSGQTLGKRLRGVRAVRTTGEPLGWSGSLLRYGVIIFALNALWFMAGPLAVALVLFAVLGWMRNANQQGMHDRIAKTLVVAAD